MKNALDVIMSDIWAIEPGYLRRIIEIVQRHEDRIDSIDWRSESNHGDISLIDTTGFEILPETRNVRMSGSTGIIPILGPIFRFANLFTEISGATSLSMLSRDFEIAENSPAVDSIMLWSHSPGGQATQIAEFSKVVANASKPVTAYVGDQAASAAYWIVSGADRIIVSPTAMLGSIGVVGTFRRPNDKEIRIYSNQSPLKKMDMDSAEGMADIQRTIDELAQVFIDSVAENRNVSPEKVVSDFGRGGVLIGENSVSAGMADEVGSFNSTIEAFSMAKNITPKTTGMSADDLKAENPELYNEIFAIGKKYGVEEGKTQEAVRRGDAADQERERIKGVFAQSLPGHDELVKKLAYDGHTTAEQAALEVLKAERESRQHAHARITDERQSPVIPSRESNAGGDDLLPLDQKLKKKWDRDPELRSEFGDNFDAYLKFEKMSQEGRIRLS